MNNAELLEMIFKMVKAYDDQFGKMEQTQIIDESIYNSYARPVFDLAVKEYRARRFQ